ncbi:MAG: hypothetical protein ACQEXC_09510 [Pseudomonadota bacterium]
MHLVNISLEEKNQDPELEKPIFIVHAKIYAGSKWIGRVESHVFQHCAYDAEHNHGCTWVMDPKIRFTFAEGIDEDQLQTSKILLELEEHVDDKLNLPILNVYQIEPRIYFEPDWTSGFGSFSLRVQLLNNIIEIHDIDYEISPEGLYFTGDNDDSYREALTRIQSHYGHSDRKIENIRNEIDKQLENKLKNDFGITNLEEALAYQDSPA